MADRDAEKRATELFYQYGKRLEVPRGEELYSSVRDQGKGYTYLLDSGFCSLAGLTRDGREHIFLYFPGRRIVGFMQLMPVDFGEGAPIVITTMTPCVVYRVTQEQFHGFLDDPLFQRYMLQVLSENFLNLIKHYQSAQDQCATCRLCGLLLDYAEEEGGRLRMPAYFNMAELSRYLGVHTVTVSRIVSQLKQRGFIEKQGHRIVLTDPAGLEKLIKNQANFDF